MKSPRIRLLLLPALAAAILLAAGCSKDTTNKPRPTPFGQTDADDIAQQLGASLGTDPGGWMFEITQSMQQRVANGDTALDMMPPGTGMSYHLSYAYTDSINQPRTSWDGFVTDADAFAKATGTITAMGTAGSFHHWSDMLIEQANQDTSLFSTLALDTTLCAIQSFFRGDSAHWYITTFYDYDEVKMYKDPGTSPWPASGVVSWLIDARQLNSMDPANVNRDLLVEATLTFNGTQLVPGTVYEYEEDPSTQFHYWFDLKTGLVQRR